MYLAHCELESANSMITVVFVVTIRVASLTVTTIIVSPSGHTLPACPVSLQFGISQLMHA